MLEVDYVGVGGLGFVEDGVAEGDLAQLAELAQIGHLAHSQEGLVEDHRGLIGLVEVFKGVSLVIG